MPHPTRPRSTPRFLTPLISLTLIAAAFTHPVMAADTYWDAGTGDWFIAGNWDTGNVPTSSDDTFIDNRGSVQIQTTGAETDNFYVGDAGHGTLIIENGGTLTNAFSYIGNNSDGAGSVTVTGADSLWTNGQSHKSGELYIGNAGTGELNISDGGSVMTHTDAYLGYQAGSQGLMTVSGANSNWTSGQGYATGRAYIGYKGKGSLRIENGASFSPGSWSYIAYGQNSKGSVTVTGNSSQWINNFGVFIGYAGDGELNIQNGGTIINDDAKIGGYGGAGSVSISNSGSSWINNGSLFIASAANSTGSLTISKKAFVKSTVTYIGGKGSANITGAGSKWVNSASFYVGYFGESNNKGILNIKNGATVSGNGHIGYNAAGETNVTGKGSTWESPYLNVGIKDTGFLNITEGGYITSKNQGRIGRDLNGKGYVTVSGIGSSWSIGDEIYVGRKGDGSLQIKGGGSVSADTYGYIAFEESSQASATISGSGSSWLIGEDLSIGYGGTGLLTIAESGAASAGGGTGTATLASATGSTGTLNIGADASETATAPGNLQAGTLAFGDGDGTLVFNHTGTDYSFDPAIIGAGAINVLSGTTLLTADSSGFGGQTTITGGTLRVNNQFGGAIAVNGGVLGGNGTVGSVTVNSGGVAPGNSIGTLNVNGDIDFSGGGTFQVEVDPNGIADKIVASGTATLSGGSVQVIPESGTYGDSTDYTILTAGTLVGEFDAVSATTIFLDPTLSYDANHVYLNLTRNATAYASVGNTPNQRAVGSTIDTLMQGGGADGLQPLLDDLNTLTATGARRAYDNLGGLQHTTLASLIQSNRGHLSRLLSHRLNVMASPVATTSPSTPLNTPIQLAYNGDLSDLQLALGPSPATTGSGPAAGDQTGPDHGFHAWLTPQAGKGNLDDTHNAPGADYRYHGLYGGVDKALNDHLRSGVALGYTETDGDLQSGDATLDSLELAFYGRWQDEADYLDATLSFARHEADTERTVIVGTTRRIADSDYDADTWGLSLEAGRALVQRNTLQITPFLGLDYSHLDRDGFVETGAGAANLAVNGDRQESVQSRLGLQLDHRCALKGDKALTTGLRLAWAHEFGDDNASASAGFAAAPSASFVIDGPALNRDSFLVDAGVTLSLGEHASLRLGYAGRFASTDEHHGLSARFQIQW